MGHLTIKLCKSPPLPHLWGRWGLTLTGALRLQYSYQPEMCTLSSSSAYYEPYFVWLLCRSGSGKVYMETWLGSISSCSGNAKAFTRLFQDLCRPAWLPSSVSPPSTIPTNLSTTLSRPDLVLISKIPSICLSWPYSLPSNTYWLQVLERKTDITLYCRIFSTLVLLLISLPLR